MRGLALGLQTRPDLRVNARFSEMVDQFRTFVRVKEPPSVKAGEVPCDVCTATQLNFAAEFGMLNLGTLKIFKYIKNI